MWQKYLGRGLVAADMLLLAIEALIGVKLDWHQPLIVGLTLVVNFVISLFPPSAVAVAVDTAKTAAIAKAKK